MRRFAGLGLALLALSANAWAINKCTGSDGKVSYQEAPCPSATRAQEVAAPSGPATGADKDWRFERTVDSMTNETTCAVVSPPVHAVGRTYRDLSEARVIVSASSAGRFLAGVQIYRGNLIHNNVTGMGIKVEPGQFRPLDIKAGQKLVSTSQSSQLIDEMLGGRTVRLRLRFWPYDDLIDTDTAQLTGFRQAMLQAAACAKAG